MYSIQNIDFFVLAKAATILWLDNHFMNGKAPSWPPHHSEHAF